MKSRLRLKANPLRNLKVNLTVNPSLNNSLVSYDRKLFQGYEWKINLDSNNEIKTQEAD